MGSMSQTASDEALTQTNQEARIGCRAQGIPAGVENPRPNLNRLSQIILNRGVRLEIPDVRQKASSATQ
jgi:hypothetical protein